MEIFESYLVSKNKFHLLFYVIKFIIIQIKRLKAERYIDYRSFANKKEKIIKTKFNENGCLLQMCFGEQNTIEV